MQASSKGACHAFMSLLCARNESLLSLAALALFAHAPETSARQRKRATTLFRHSLHKLLWVSADKAQHNKHEEKEEKERRKQEEKQRKRELKQRQEHQEQAEKQKKKELKQQKEQQEVEEKRRRKEIKQQAS